MFKGLTGLFNNPNYAGAWLNIVWPFALALLIELRKEMIKAAESLDFEKAAKLRDEIEKFEDSIKEAIN